MWIIKRMDEGDINVKIIVTGKHGYLSNKIADFLNRQGHDVRKVSIRGMVETCDYLDSEVIIHVAGLVSSEDVNQFYEINTKKTQELFDIAERNHIKHFIYISSMAVYGLQTQKMYDNSITLQTSTDSCTDYGKSKLLAEQKIVECAQETKWTILRVPSLYDENKMEYFDNYKKVVEKLPVIPCSRGVTKRSVLCVDNLCILLSEVIENRKNQYMNKIVLPCDEVTPDFKDIVKKVMADLGVSKPIVCLPKNVMNILGEIVPQIKFFSFNAYYSETDCTKIRGKNYCDVQIY